MVPSDIFNCCAVTCWNPCCSDKASFNWSTVINPICTSIEPIGVPVFLHWVNASTSCSSVNSPFSIKISPILFLPCPSL
ncbi:unknown [Clostridium sp. CAG:306]|nr:unknown [Clostridium sp. CAG:306]